MDFNQIKRLIVVDDLNNESSPTLEMVLNRIQEIFLCEGNTIECYFICHDGTTKHIISIDTIENRTEELTELQRTTAYNFAYLEEHYDSFIQVITQIIESPLQEAGVTCLFIDYRIPDNNGDDASRMINILTSLYQHDNPNGDNHGCFGSIGLKVVGYSSWQTILCRDKIIDFRDKYKISNLYYMTIPWEQECKIEVRYHIKNHIN